MDKLAVARTLIKVIALALGLLATLLCLMALVGLVTGNGWARAGLAVLVAVALPAVIADRLLPHTPDAKAKGVTSDVFALSWMVLPVLFAVALGSFTRPALAREGDRLTTSGWDLTARAAYLLAGVRADVAAPAPAPEASASTTSEPAPVASSAAATVPPPPPPSSASGSAAPSAAAPTKPGTEVNAADLFKKLAPAVVTVTVKNEGGREGGGTGFIIDKTGIVVTNHHVIDDSVECTIKALNGALYSDVWVLEDDAAADIAILQIDLAKPKEGTPPELTIIPLGDSDKVQVGEAVFVIGNPLGLDHTLTTGIVSSRRTYEGKRWIQMTAPISPGNSGGPVFDAHGEAIGIATAVIHGYGMGQNLNLAVPIIQLKALIKPSYPGKRKLGKSATSGSW